MSKQDRQGVRKASDIEQKYGLGQFMYDQNKKNQDLSKGISNLGDSFSNYKTENEKSVSSLKENCESLSKSLSGFQKTTDEKFNEVDERIESEIESLSGNVSKNAEDIKNLEAQLATITSGEQKVLWGGDMTSGMYMIESHTANLSENISKQKNGIILVFCYYNGTSDTNWNYIFHTVPKKFVALNPGVNSCFLLARSALANVGTKRLYINDNRITGHSDNDASGTSASGIKYENNKFVLRYVIGY